MAEKILEVVNLGTRFKTERGVLKAIDGVSFDVYRGEMLGIVGESGCGKSVTSQSILRLYDEKRLAVYSGEVRFEGKNLFDLSEKEMQDIRGEKISMVFQDALSSLNPVFTVGNQIMESLRDPPEDLQAGGERPGHRDVRTGWNPGSTETFLPVSI